MNILVTGGAGYIGSHVLKDSERMLLVVLTDCYHFGKQICGLWIPLDAQAFQGSVITIYLQLLSA